MDEVEKNSFIALPGKGGYSANALKFMCPNLEGAANLKISHSLKVERVLFGGNILGLQAQETATQVDLRGCSQEVGKEVRVNTILPQRGQAV